MNVLLVAVSVAYLLFLAGVEAWTIFSGSPTISLRIQEWVKRNYQIAIALGAIAGWLIAHFSGMP
jgi:hypothetical protein